MDILTTISRTMKEYPNEREYHKYYEEIFKNAKNETKRFFEGIIKYIFDMEYNKIKNSEGYESSKFIVELYEDSEFKNLIKMNKKQDLHELLNKDNKFKQLSDRNRLILSHIILDSDKSDDRFKNFVEECKEYVEESQPLRALLSTYIKINRILDSENLSEKSQELRKRYKNVLGNLSKSKELEPIPFLKYLVENKSPLSMEELEYFQNSEIYASLFFKALEVINDLI